jgi:hypothetical protein
MAKRDNLEVETYQANCFSARHTRLKVECVLLRITIPHLKGFEVIACGFALFV